MYFLPSPSRNAYVFYGNMRPTQSGMLAKVTTTHLHTYFYTFKKCRRRDINVDVFFTLEIHRKMFERWRKKVFHSFQRVHTEYTQNTIEFDENGKKRIVWSQIELQFSSLNFRCSHIRRWAREREKWHYQWWLHSRLYVFAQLNFTEWIFYKISHSNWQIIYSLDFFSVRILSSESIEFSIECVKPLDAIETMKNLSIKHIHEHATHMHLKSKRTMKIDNAKQRDDKRRFKLFRISFAVKQTLFSCSFFCCFI